MRQRQTWNLRHHHRIRRILCHPDRQLRQSAVGLTDGHSDIVTTAIATGYDDRLPVTGMKSVTDNRLAQLIVSIMKLSRRHQAPSSGAGTHHHSGRWPTSDDEECRSAREASAAQSAAVRLTQQDPAGYR